MSHFRSVFNNSCVKVPVDPLSRMPIADYERKAKRNEQRAKNKRLSIDSNSSVSSFSKADMDAQQVREFYKSIPDYKDIHHLNEDEFYSTLKCLREKKQQMLGYSVSHIDDVNGNGWPYHDSEAHVQDTAEECVQLAKCNLNESLKKTQGKDIRIFCSDGGQYSSNLKKITDDLESILADVNLMPEKTPGNNEKLTDCVNGLKTTNTLELSPKYVVSVDTSKEPNIRSESRSKRNHSACSISWNDQCAGNVNDEVDSRFDKYCSPEYCMVGKERKSRSMPSSPLKARRKLSPDLYRKHTLTIPKPFKMTLRDDDERVSSGLKCLSKSFSDEMLHRKGARRRFRARAVPVESRIPLYDKILEDQAMRFQDYVELCIHHAERFFVENINSAAELQAQMRPFSFTERERRACARHQRASGDLSPPPASAAGTAARKFRARPIPRNLFSNYVSEKMREEDFFRALNRRIRAEELLRAASLPPSMAARDKSAARSRSRVSGGTACAGALLSDLPTDTPSELSSGKSGGRRARKFRRTTKKKPFNDFITTSPQPFHFSTASRATRKEDISKIYGKRESSPLRSAATATAGSAQARTLSALDVPSVNRSNLAAVLRIESTKKRLEEEVTRRLVEQQQRAELRWRDHVLRRKPVWQLVRNNYEEDIAMRLQTRRDEERLRREEFLHDMELMYGRVRQQPLLFERYYTGRPRRNLVHVTPHDSNSNTPQRKSSKRGSRSAPLRHATPGNSRKVSINETAETINDDFIDYLNGMGEEKLLSGSESLCDVNSAKNN